MDTRTRAGGRWLAVAIAVLAAWVGAGAAAAAEIKVLSAGAVRPVVTGLAETFRQETGHVLTLDFGTAGALRQKVTAGEPADVVIVTDTVIDELTRQGHVVAGTRTDIARVGIGVAVRQSAPLPDISSTEAFKPLPRELQKITTYSAGLVARSATPEAARAFIAFLARPAFKAKFAEAGLDYRE